jgi:tRNA A-37 threonylcarbamoyl transferase component Bud32
MDKCICNNTIKSALTCMKCKNKAFCSNNCLVQHNFSIHQSDNTLSDNFKPKLSVSKRPNILVQEESGEKSKETIDKYSYKNFHVVKRGSNRHLLGKGAFGEVCLVKHKYDGLFYAMKIIEKKNLKNKTDSIKQEIKNHLQLDHPNIIKLLNYSETQDYVYLAMEYAENGSLFQEVRKIGKLNEHTAKKYFSQTLEAVCYLHERGFTHRDIKPENLLLDKHKNVKLCDFGGTVLLKENQERKTFFGTYEYMAPEIIEGSSYNSSVDIWALGILLYELLHGYSPFRVSTKTFIFLK